MFNLATAQMTTSTSSSYWGEWEGAIPAAQKKMWHIIPAPVPWTQMITIDGQLCPWKDISNLAPRKKKKDEKKPARHFQVGYIHSFRKNNKATQLKKHNRTITENYNTITHKSQIPLQTINL